MALDTNIALGVKPIEQPNMLAQMGQMMQMRQMQQEYEGENALRGALQNGLPEDPSTLLKYGSKGRAVYESVLKGNKDKLDSAEKYLGLYKDQAGFIKNPEDAARWLTAFYANPATRPFVEATAPLDKALAAIPRNDPAAFQAWLRNASLKSEKLFVDANTIASNQARIQAANIGAAPANARLDMEKKERAEADQLFGRPTATTSAAPMMGGGGVPSAAPISAPASGGVPNALPATVGATPAAPAANMLVPGAQAPATTPATTPAPSPAFAPTGDPFDKIKAIEAEITRLRPYMSNPRIAANVQQLNTDRIQLLALAERQYGGNIVDMTIADPNDPTKSITVKGKLDQYGIAQPLRTGAMPRDVDISTGTSIDIPVARPAPPAPVYKDIVNPNNEKQMITINVNEYKGGGVGAKGERAPGVLGVAGKEPTAALREQKTIGAEEALKGELDNLRFAYGKLNEAEAIPSTARSGISNLGASTQASDTGQFLGKVFGTTEQSLRDNIKSSNLRLLQSIKNATGMSAQELNSNMELKTWIDSLTNPKTAYETNIKNIDNIENFVKKRANRPASGGAPATGAQADPLGIR
jgi:hypothetical protein